MSELVNKEVEELRIKNLITESRNKRSYNIDSVNTREMVRIINDEDKKVALAVEEQLPQIAKAIDAIYEKMAQGGRLIYIGAGTSGRVGVLDAVECPPTFSVDTSVVQALIAGGDRAFVKAVEGAEDNYELAEVELNAINFTSKDVLVGIAASGRTPYVVGGLTYANSIGALTVCVTCNPEAPIIPLAKHAIVPVTGPEVVTGSTRLKAGTAQKMVLNMISTCVMIKLGKVYGNLMVDVKATNEKLFERAENIVCEVTGTSNEKAEEALRQADFSVKTAIMMIECGVSANEAKTSLKRHNHMLRDALLSHKKKAFH